MFNPIITKERILKRSEEIGVPVGTLLKSCGLSRNFISQLGSQKRNVSASHLLALTESTSLVVGTISYISPNAFGARSLLFDFFRGNAAPVACVYTPFFPSMYFW